MRTIDYIRKVLLKMKKMGSYSKSFNEGLKLEGEFELIATNKDGKIIDHIKEKNIILNNIKEKVIQSLMTGSIDKIFRMAIGDNGAIVGDPFTPKVPSATDTALEHEVYRKDVSWPPSVDTANLKITFIGTFNSVDVPSTSYSNASEQRVNEAMLVCGDGVLGGGDIYSPNPADADESGVSRRCFKSIPFDIANDITITIRWSLFMR